MAEVVGWDLDSSVCCTMHRRHLVPKIRAGQATWDDYSDLCVDDEPIEGAVALMRFMSQLNPKVQHVAISGRSVRALELTQAWAHLHGVPFSRYMLRPDDQDNELWKVRCIRQLQAEGYTVRLFFEDWDRVARYIREHTGVPVVGLNPFDEGSALVTRDQLAAELEKELNSTFFQASDIVDRIFDRLGGAW